MGIVYFPLENKALYLLWLWFLESLGMPEARAAHPSLEGDHLNHVASIEGGWLLIGRMWSGIKNGSVSYFLCQMILCMYYIKYY